MAPVRELGGPSGAPPDDAGEEARDERPVGPAWRADALAPSRHSRLLDEVARPLADFDLPRSTALCAEICRDLLRDLAPALLLVPRRERRRAQALAAHARALFDFASQLGIEGERLAQINRWEYSLESALEHEPVGQPVCVCMAHEEARRPWPRPALATLAAAARRRATHDPGQPTPHEETRAIALALYDLLIGIPASTEAEELATALLYGAARRQAGAHEASAAAAELRRSPASGLPPAWRSAARYLQLALLRLLAQTERPATERGLSAFARVGLLLRACC